MPLRKEIRVNDELDFDLAPGTEAMQHVKIRLSEVVGRSAILVITANKDPVPIKHMKYSGFQRIEAIKGP